MDKKIDRKSCLFFLNNRINDYFPAAGAEAGAVASAAAAAFLCFLCFLVAAGAEAGAAASTAGAAGVAAGVAAKAETANRLATKAASMVFILDPIKLKHVELSNPRSNNGMGSLWLTIIFRISVYF